MLREIMDEWVVIPMGERLLEFDGIIELNESAAFLWKLLEKNRDSDELVNALIEKYKIDRSHSEKEVKQFLVLLEQKELLEE